MSINHPYAPQKDSKGRAILYRYLEDTYPVSYQMSLDWNAYGALPPDLPPATKETKAQSSPSEYPGTISTHVRTPRHHSYPAVTNSGTS